MDAKVLLGSGLALLLLLSSCRLLEDMEDSGQPSSFICATDVYMQNMPQFPGGYKQMWQFLANNLIWPPELENSCISGLVVARLSIEKNGAISSIEIAKSLVPALDAETIRVIKKMPKWIPGEVDGKPVRSEFLLPVKWTIE